MFSIEASNDPNQDHATVERQVSDLEEAKSIAEQFSKQFRAVWLAERGVRVDTRTADWFYFWWSEAVSDHPDWGPPEERGVGYAESGPNFKVSYEPTTP